MAADVAATARRWELPRLASGNGAPRTARQIDDVEVAARQDGFAQGFREGREAGLKDAAALALRMGALIENFSRPLEHLDAEVEQVLVSLALRVGRELALKELKSDPAAVIEVVRAAIKALPPPPREVHVHLRPDDIKAVKELLAAAPPDAPWRLVADASLGPGDCRVTADASLVDARLDARFAELSQALLG